MKPSLHQRSRSAAPTRALCSRPDSARSQQALEAAARTAAELRRRRSRPPIRARTGKLPRQPRQVDFGGGACASEVLGRHRAITSAIRPGRSKDMPHRLHPARLSPPPPQGPMSDSSGPDRGGRQRSHAAAASCRTPHRPPPASRAASRSAICSAACSAATRAAAAFRRVRLRRLGVRRRRPDRDDQQLLRR